MSGFGWNQQSGPIAPVLIYPVVGVLLMGLCMTFVVEPIMGGINTGLNNALTGMGNSSKVILGLVLGGMMAIDMGGPFNKAAYVFGTAAIAAGNYDIMAAVMVGGMTPPCAIALASLLFKDKFTKEEREAGPTNFIMGLAFITEGAIPFAASDPVHVLPSCIVGSAAAGAISMFFNCTLMAPHGGIFVFPVVGNAMMYLVALVVGTLISAVLLGELVKLVKGFESKITIEKDGKTVECRKLLALMGLGVKKGHEVTFTFDGADEDAAYEAVSKFMQENL